MTISSISPAPAFMAEPSTSAEAPPSAGPLRPPPGALRPRGGPVKRWPTVRTAPPTLPQIGENPPAMDAALAKWFRQQKLEQTLELDIARLGRRYNAPPDAGDKDLAAYVLARKVDDRDVPPDLLDMLKRGNAGLKQTRALLHRGRGNVKPDLEASGNETHYVTAATRDVIEEEEKKGRPLNLGVTAGVVASTATGNCVEHGLVNVYVQTPMLKQGETVTCKWSTLRDHAWNEFNGAYKVRLDAWKDGPAIEDVDADKPFFAFPRTLVEMTPADARNAADELRYGQQSEGPHLKGRIDELAQEHKARNSKPFITYERSPLVKKAFAKRVTQALEKLGEPDGKVADLTQDPHKQVQRDWRNEVLAADAARRVGCNIRDAAKVAQEVSELAKRMHQPLQRRAPQEDEEGSSGA